MVCTTSPAETVNANDVTITIIFMKYLKIKILDW